MAVQLAASGIGKEISYSQEGTPILIPNHSDGNPIHANGNIDNYKRQRRHQLLDPLS